MGKQKISTMLDGTKKHWSKKGKMKKQKKPKNHAKRTKMMKRRRK